MERKIDQTMVKKNDDINYFFILKCLGALTAAALVTAGIIAAVATKISTIAITGVVAAALITATPIAPLVGVVALMCIIGALCLLPFLFSGGNTYASVRPQGYVYNNPGSYQPTIFVPLLNIGRDSRYSGQSTIHHNDRPGPIHYNGGRGPIHHNDRSGPIHYNGGRGPIHHNDGSGPIHYNGGRGPIHHNDGPGPIHIRKS